MRILIVEDSPQARQLLLYLLQERFMDEAKFREAQDLKTAFDYLKMWKDADIQARREGKPIDPICVILDLSLPDSAGRETFTRIQKAYPDLPIVVMTNTNDRKLAEEMVDHGAQDYILKNFTDEEEIFRRVSFAVRRHRRTVSVPPKDAESVHKLESSRAQLRKAHSSGMHKSVEARSVEVLEGTAELVQKSFVGIQSLGLRFEKSEVTQEHMAEDLRSLNDEVRGSGGRRSMRSELEILDHQIGGLKSDFKDLKGRVEKIEDGQSEADKTGALVAAQLGVGKMDSRTKIIVAVIGLLGLLITGYFAYKFGIKL